MPMLKVSDQRTGGAVTIHGDGAAVAGANRKQVGDAWRWTRRSSSTEVTPLVALTLAVRAARDTPPQFVPRRIR